MNGIPVGCKASIRRCVRRGAALQNSEYKSVGYGTKAVELKYGGFINDNRGTEEAA
jgi:hypothetical protein